MGHVIVETRANEVQTFNSKEAVRATCCMRQQQEVLSEART